jgi:hypothetical protein
MGHHHIRVSVQGTDLFTTTEHKVKAIEVCGTKQYFPSDHQQGREVFGT